MSTPVLARWFSWQRSVRVHIWPILAKVRGPLQVEKGFFADTNGLNIDILQPREQSQPSIAKQWLWTWLSW